MKKPNWSPTLLSFILILRFYGLSHSSTRQQQQQQPLNAHVKPNISTHTSSRRNSYMQNANNTTHTQTHALSDNTHTLTHTHIHTLVCVCVKFSTLEKPSQ